MATCSKCDGRGVRLMRPDAHGPSMCTRCHGTGVEPAPAGNYPEIPDSSPAPQAQDALAGFRAQLIEHLRDTGYPGYADYLQTEFKHAAAENARLTAVVEAAREWKAARADYCAYSYEHTHGQPDQRRYYEVRDRLRAAKAQLEAALSAADAAEAQQLLAPPEVEDADMP